MNETKIKLAEQNLATFKARLRTAGPERDQVRRQIKATEELLRKLRAE